jgi:hypothetical protein
VISGDLICHPEQLIALRIEKVAIAEARTTYTQVKRFSS